jgi:hypothetical protein
VSAASLLWLPLWVALMLGLQALLAHAVKTVWSAARPLADGEPELAGYERKVHHTGEREPLTVLGLALASGLALTLWAAGAGAWAGVLSLLALLAALAVDLLGWQRVAVSGEAVWVQRGLRRRVHRLALDDIAEVEVVESASPLFSLRRGRAATLARLVLRLHDGSQAALPRTDADSPAAMEAMEEVANRIRARQLQASTRGELGRGSPP